MIQSPSAPDSAETYIMLIGIISDTHNRIEMTRRAVEIFKERKINLLIHAGDLTSPKMLELFTDFPCRLVLGNGDIDCEEINAKSNLLGLCPLDELCAFEADKKKFIVFHGDNVALFREAVASGEYDFIIKGHTHVFEDYTANRSRVINPGALYAAEEYTVAVLDTDTEKLEMIRIEDES